MKKRHLLRRIGAHAGRLNTKVASLVANTMTAGNVARCAEITLATAGHSSLDQQLAGVKRTTSTLLVNEELDADSSETLCRKQILRFYDRIRDHNPPKLVAAIIKYLKAEPMSLRKELGSDYDTRNGWAAMAELAKQLKWPQARLGKGQQKNRLRKLGRKWRRTQLEEVGSQSSAALRYCDLWRNDVKAGLPDYLARPCRMHLRTGKRLKTMFRLSAWRFETGASHAKCPRCGLAAHSAEHVLFECPKVVPEARNVFLKEMGTLMPKFTGYAPKRQLRLVLAGNSPSLWDVPLYSFLRSVAEDKV